MILVVEDSEVGQARAAKVKIVAALAKSALEVKALKHPSDKQFIGLPFKRLPFLETAEGKLSHSNAIIRFLAQSRKQLLGGNAYEEAKVNELVDFLSQELGVVVYTSQLLRSSADFQADRHKLKSELARLTQQVEKVVDGKYLVGKTVTLADVTLASILAPAFKNHLGPEARSKLPKLTQWFKNIAAESGFKEVLGAVEFLAVDEKADHKKEGKKGGKDNKDNKDEKKAAADDEFDLFGEDTAAAEKKEAPKPKPKEEKKKEKKPVIAKTILFFDVKVYEQETDLEALAQKIYAEVNQDGLTWNKEHQILPVAFGMNKLQMKCVIEDEKVYSDDIYEKILAWEDTVQSVDTEAMQKL